MTKIKVTTFLFFILILVLSVTSVFAEYTGPKDGERRFSYECGEDLTDTCDANYADASIQAVPFCSTGFGHDNWCAGEINVTLVGRDDYKGIIGFESSDGQYVAAAGGTTETVVLTYNGEQDQEVEFWALSGLGDTSIKQALPIRIDHSMPVNSIEVSGTLSEDNWYKGPVTITSTAADTYLEKTWVDAGFGETLNSYTIPESFTGIIAPKVRSVDLANNDTGWQTFSAVNIDNTLPYIKNIYDPQSKWFNSSVPLYVFGEDKDSGVLSSYIFVDETDTGARGNAASSSYVPSEGEHEVTYQVEDKANNKSELAGPYYFGYDITQPEITLSSNQSFDIVGPVITISGEISDNLSGAKIVEIRYGRTGNWMRVSGQPSNGATSDSWSHTITADTAEGFNLFYVRVTDQAGNVSSLVSFTLNRDYTPPETVGMRTEGTIGEGGAYRGAVTFIGEAEDSVAGVRSIYVDLGLGNGEKLNNDTTPSDYSGVVSACVRAVDNVGNSTDCIKQENVTVDNDKPYVAKIDTLDKTIIYTPEATFNVSGADDLSGMYSVTIAIDGTPFTKLGDTGSIEMGILGDGPHTITVSLKDKAGNILDSTTDSSLTITGITTDGSKPTAVISNFGINGYAKDSLPFSGSISDNIAVNNATLKIDGLTVMEFGPYNGTSGSFTETIDVSSLDEGTHQLELTAFDKAGNVSDPAIADFIIDRTKPTVSVTTNGTKGDGGAYRGIVTFAGEAEDDGSGIKEIFVDLGNGEKRNSTTSSADFSGMQTVCVRAIDNVGNDSGCVNQESVLIDNQKPSPVSYTHVDEKPVFIEGDSFEVTGSDEHSGMYSVSILLDGQPYTKDGETNSVALAILSDGNHTVEFELVDKAGNIYRSEEDPAVKTGSIVIDKTGPETTIDKPAEGQYAKDSLTVSGKATDNIGLNKIFINVDGKKVKELSANGKSFNYRTEVDTSDLEEGIHTVTVQVFDQGNIHSEEITRSFNIDRTAPEVSMRTEGKKGPGDVYNGIITFIGEATDSGSGVDKIFVNIGDGEKTNQAQNANDFSGIVSACIRATDKVGNSNECIKQDGVLVDNKKPFLSSYTKISDKEVFVNNDQINVIADDEHSGIYSVEIIVDGEAAAKCSKEDCSFTLTALSDGEHTIEYVATDNAGNVYETKDDAETETGTIIFDKTKPEVSFTKPEEKEFAGDSLHVSGQATDNIGLNSVVIIIDETEYKKLDLAGKKDTFNTVIDTSKISEGEHTLSITAYDKGMNPSETASRTVIIDHTAPECHIDVFGDRGDGGYFRGEIKLTVVCDDSGAGVDKTYVNNGEGRVENEIIINNSFTGKIEPKAAGTDKVGNDSGDVNNKWRLGGSDKELDSVMIDNKPPRITDFFEPYPYWVKVKTLDMFVTGEDSEGPIYSGTIVINGIESTIIAEENTAETVFNMAEGISSLKYYVTDYAGNTSEIIGGDVVQVP